MVRALLLAALVVLACPATGSELKLATWNIKWLTTKRSSHPDLPNDVVTRTEADWRALRGYAERLDADIVAVQEIDGEEPLKRVFDPARYELHLTSETDIQRPGFAVRKGLVWRANPDLVGLDINPGARFSLRRGADISVQAAPGRWLRLLSIHLKTGCQRDALEQSTRFECQSLAQQVPVLARWVMEREAGREPYAVLGDFNRQMDREDAMWSALSAAGRVTRANAGMSNPCWGGNSFIDHIVLGGEARDWMVPASLRVLVYRETDRRMRDRLSDHCPVSVRLAPR